MQLCPRRTIDDRQGTLNKIKSSLTRRRKWELSGDPTEATLLVAGAKRRNLAGRKQSKSIKD